MTRPRPAGCLTHRLGPVCPIWSGRLSPPGRAAPEPRVGTSACSNVLTARPAYIRLLPSSQPRREILAGSQALTSRAPREITGRLYTPCFKVLFKLTAVKRFP